MVKKITRCLFLTWLLILSSFAMYGNVVYALSPASDTIYQGIDISAYQGNINFNEVKNAGIDIVYIKASEGDNFEDPYFRRHYEGAINSGITVSYTHLTLPTTIGV
jgi:lysozyme